MFRLTLFVALLLAGAAARAAPRWQPLANDASCVVWDDDPAEEVSVTWTGGCINGRASGRGSLTWRFVADGKPQEHACRGDMRNGKLHGQAACAWSNGGRYDGGWSDGRQHGRGVEYFDDGSRYEGGFWLGPREGRGTYDFADGGRYEGGWHDNAMHGEGTRFYSNGARYAGGWANDAFHGHGTLVFADGDRCEGEWADGALVGTGTGLRDGKPATCRYDKKQNQVSFGQ